jgi:hypothetical protein
MLKETRRTATEASSLAPGRHRESEAGSAQWAVSFGESVYIVGMRLVVRNRD